MNAGEIAGSARGHNAVIGQRGHELSARRRQITLAICVSIGSTGIVSQAHAGRYCEHIANEDIGIGDARYSVLTGSDQSSANTYHDGGSALSIDMWAPIGYVWTLFAETFDTVVTAYIEDDSTSDCKVAEIR